MPKEMSGLKYLPRTKGLAQGEDLGASFPVFAGLNLSKGAPVAAPVTSRASASVSPPCSARGSRRDECWRFQTPKERTKDHPHPHIPPLFPEVPFNSIETYKHSSPPPCRNNRTKLFPAFKTHTLVPSKPQNSSVPFGFPKLERQVAGRQRGLGTGKLLARWECLSLK